MGATGTRVVSATEGRLWMDWAQCGEIALACPMPHSNNLVKALAIATVIGLTSFGVAATSAAAPPSPANTQKLVAALPNGYGPATCAAADLTSDSIAVVDCKQNALVGGPAVARYILYGTPSDLANHFAAIIADDSIFPCAPDEPAPQTWHYNSSPDVIAGQVSCGTYDGTAELAWTSSGQLLMASAHGSDINAMYTWWLANG